MGILCEVRVDFQRVSEGLFMIIMQYFKNRYESIQEEEFILEEYLEICKKDLMVYVMVVE